MACTCLVVSHVCPCTVALHLSCPGSVPCGHHQQAAGKARRSLGGELLDPTVHTTCRTALRVTGVWLHNACSNGMSQVGTAGVGTKSTSRFISATMQRLSPSFNIVLFAFGTFFFDVMSEASNPTRSPLFALCGRFFTTCSRQ